MKKELFIYKKWEKTNLLQASSVLLGFCVGKKKNKQLKPLFKNAFIVLKKNNGILYWQEKSLEKTVKKINDLISKKPKYQTELFKEVRKKAKEVKKTAVKIVKLNLNKKSDQEMIKMLQQLSILESGLTDLVIILSISNFKEKNVIENLAKEAEKSLEQAMNLIIKEISRRTFYSVEQLDYALPLEIKNIFKKKGLKRYKLDERQKFCVVYLDRNGKIRVLIGDETKKYLKK